MGATFSRVKNWTTEVLSDTDLNAEIDNILNNLTPSGVDDYSATATQMQTDTDGGESGTESLATSLAGELERLRFAIREIKGSGVSYWYQSANTSLTELNNALSATTFNHRIVSGQSRTGSSSQAVFLTCTGTTTSLVLSAATTNFVYYVQGTQYTRTADVTLSSLTAGPSTNNTCAVNMTIATGQMWTKHLGEYGTSIPVDGMDSSISSLVGNYAAFKVSTEIFTAYVDSTTSLTHARRGLFFDSSNTPLSRVAISDNNTITLLKLGWLFLRASGTMQAVYNNPTVSNTTPSSPSFGDYWFDIVNSKWKTYSLSSTWDDTTASFVGICAQDTTACIGTRSLDFFKNNTDTNTLEFDRTSNTQCKSINADGELNVYGSLVRFTPAPVTWDITTDLDSGVGETASQNYYCYVNESGKRIMSDVLPHDRRADLKGHYHPHNTWRCVGYAYNDASSNLTTGQTFGKNPKPTAVYLKSGAANYTTPIGATKLVIKAVGGGGGGSGSGTASMATGGSGGNTTFTNLGVNLIFAASGAGGTAASLGGIGGGASVSPSAIEVITVQGARGTGTTTYRLNGTPSLFTAAGGGGGNSAFGGGGAGSENTTGGAGIDNTGGGGAGGGVQASTASNISNGTGGGAGGYVEAIIFNPQPAYSYSVGTAGTAGGAGVSGMPGGAGGSGLISIAEFYN